MSSDLVSEVEREGTWRREKFCREFSPQVPFALTSVESAREALSGRRFWSLATNALEPVADGSWLMPGSHVNSIQGREVDDETVARADLVVVRHSVRPSHWGPPGFDPRTVRVSQECRTDISGKMATLGDVLSGQTERRPEWVTLFVGGGLEDVAPAQGVADSRSGLAA